MTAPGRLVLRDATADGVFHEETFALTDDEFESVEELVRGASFGKAMQAQDCPEAFDVEVVVTVKQGSQVREDRNAAGCMGGPPTNSGNPDHVYNRLQWLLIELQTRYLDCPEFEPTPAAAPRPLCNGCFAWSRDVPGAC